VVEGEVNRGLVTVTGGALRAGWRWSWLFGSLSIAALLLFSKFTPPFDAMWQQLDMAVFRATNASLSWGSAWQWLWGITNHRAFDAVGGGFFLVIFCWFIYRGRGEERGRRLAAGGFIFAWTVMVLDISSDWVFNFHHPSPTLSVPDAVRLSELVPNFKLKDSSGGSFPGDHGTALIMFAAMTGYYAGRRLGMLAAAGAVLFALPRLMSGAHWLSDIAVGSVSVALVALSLALATPLHSVAIRLIVLPLTKIIRLFGILRIRVRGQRGGEET
jgi:membrane-associated phospholipid phosphatase